MKTYYSTLLLITCFALHLNAVDVDAGLQGYWGFEEQSGAASVDDSAFNQQANLVNAPMWTTGKVGSALYFNGESSYVSVGAHERFAITGQLTIAAWVKLNNPSYNAYTRIVSKKYNWSDAAGYELEYNAATNRLAIIAGGSDIAYALNVDLDTQWHHVAAVVNGNSAQLYLDGQALAMTDATLGALAAGDAPLHIGRNSSAAAPFIGCIDEVRIYNKALDADTIAAVAWTGFGQRVIRWSGYNWLVKNAAVMGPGPNAWNDSESGVWIDENGHLHLQVTNVNGTWQCAEVKTKKVLGYGSYTTTLGSSLADIDPQMVLGVFVYKDDTHEVDVEYSAWGDAEQAAYRQFVQQPYYVPENLVTMPGIVDGDDTIYRIDWFANSITCHADGDSHLFANYTPVENPHMHLNLWLFQGQAPQHGQSFEVVIKQFSFVEEPEIVPEPEEQTDAYLHWTLEDAAGTTAADIASLGLDGQVLDAKWQLDIERDGYLYFDGVQDAVVVPEAPGLDVVGNRTICFWMRNDRPTISLYQRIMSKKNNWSDNSGFEVVYNPKRKELQLVGQGSRLAFARNVSLDTNWHHVTITVIGTEAQIYLDGEALHMNRSFVGTIVDNDLDLYIGRMGGGYGDFKGGLDDIRIYDKVLDADAILGLYAEGLSGVN